LSAYINKQMVEAVAAAETAKNAASFTCQSLFALRSSGSFYWDKWWSVGCPEGCKALLQSKPALSICVISHIDIFWCYYTVPLVLLPSPPPYTSSITTTATTTNAQTNIFALPQRAWKKDLGQTGNLVDEPFLYLGTWHLLKAAGKILWKVSLLMLLAKQA